MQHQLLNSILIIINIELIKKETLDHYISEGKENYYRDRVEILKEDLKEDFRKWKESNPQKQFSDYKNKCIEEMKTGMQFLGEILYIGLSLTALGEIEEKND
ncbi:Uncharacterised protein [Chryseobacterium nakagawai]|uniref:Uncharacterized protein n=1 Tax=Chryseobacterium nakagawai TaxID=1241982 RepID=A0AAD1DSK3_CHRNA|nr:hypothetical protein [Chryseobacterium nakagawai]AZA93018.1 hypothetical protein EG343_21650 [Chryseobacterium nakagawai]VEH19649.1 Uncharacterised protein [Chryseobacterium nakagawai]